jgi:hypothetical protein
LSMTSASELDREAISLAAPAAKHRSRAVTREFQREHPCPSTGLTTGACPGYWRDRVLPLACGGPDAVSNGRLFPRLGPKPRGSAGLAPDRVWSTILPTVITIYLK